MIIKSKTMRWTCSTALITEICVQNIGCELEGRFIHRCENNIEMSVNGVVTLFCGLDSCNPGKVAGSCQHGYEPSGSIKRQNNS
jgi:hypothetical protein